MSYSDYEFEMLSRQFILKEFSQDKINKLENSIITIIGVGGIGCPLANYLISSGIKNLKLIDGDKIEKSNLNRQILFSCGDIGKKKTIIASKKLKKINPYCNIKSIEQNLDHKNMNLLEGSSIVIDTCDNWQTMKIVNEYCVRNSIPLISSSVIGFDAEIVLFENKKNNHLCLNCIFPNKKDVELPRCDTVGISGIAAGMAGLITAQKTINFLTNLKYEGNILTLLNVLKGDWNNITIKRNKKCYLN